MRPRHPPTPIQVAPRLLPLRQTALRLSELEYRQECCGSAMDNKTAGKKEIRTQTEISFVNEIFRNVYQTPQEDEETPALTLTIMSGVWTPSINPGGAADAI